MWPDLFDSQLLYDLLDQVGCAGVVRQASKFLKSSRRNIVRTARAHTPWGWQALVPEKEFKAACVGAIRTLRALDPAEPTGDYVEFGVSRGTSLACMSHALADENAPGVRLLGFDSFRGLPADAEAEGWRPGAFHSSRRATAGYLKRHAANPDRIHLIEGWFSDTLTPATAMAHELLRASFVMLDCDIYSASRDALKFAKPLIGDRAIIFCDDWGARSSQGRRGQKEAFGEFLAETPHLAAQELPTYARSAKVFLLQKT